MACFSSKKAVDGVAEPAPTASAGSAGAAAAAAPADAALDGHWNLLGAMVKRVIANFDESVLGVKVEMGTVHIDPMTGRVQIYDLKVHNFKGYHSPHLMVADRLLVDIELQKLLMSFGREVVIEEVVLEGVDVIYEKGLRTSNLNDLLNNLQGPETPQDVSRTSSTTSTDASAQPSEPAVTLHQVLVRNVGAKVSTVLTRGAGIRFEVGDLWYEDFNEQMQGHRGFMTIVRVLLTSIIKSVIATIVGKSGIKKLTKCCGPTYASQPTAARRMRTAMVRETSAMPPMQTAIVRAGERAPGCCGRSAVSDPAAAGTKTTPGSGPSAGSQARAGGGA